MAGLTYTADPHIVDQAFTWGHRDFDKGTLLNLNDVRWSKGDRDRLRVAVKMGWLKRHEPGPIPAPPEEEPADIFD